MNCRDLSRAEKDFIIKALVSDTSRPRASKAQCIMAICAVCSLILGVLWEKLPFLLEIIQQMIRLIKQ